MAHARTMGVPAGPAKVADTFPARRRDRMARQDRKKNVVVLEKEMRWRGIAGAAEPLFDDLMAFARMDESGDVPVVCATRSGRANDLPRPTAIA